VANLTEIAIEQSMRLMARGLAAGRVKTIASGLENIPAEGPALIVARHYHHLYDGLALFAALRRPFHIVVTLDWAKNRCTQFFMESLTRIARWPVLLRADALGRDEKHGAPLFSREDILRYQRKALRDAVNLLIEARVVVVFPEGYPNIDPTYTPKKAPDEFLPFKPGFVNIAGAAEKRLQQQIPIIPAGLRYTTEKTWIAHLRFGDVIYYPEDCGTKGEWTARLEEEVKQLSGAGTASILQKRLRAPGDR
jgi:1-acyl-sn-glycerol-3-phosphate acyltransferase